jgi:hypothetical protein
MDRVLFVILKRVLKRDACLYRYSLIVGIVMIVVAGLSEALENRIVTLKCLAEPFAQNTGKVTTKSMIHPED